MCVDYQILTIKNKFIFVLIKKIAINILSLPYNNKQII